MIITTLIVSAVFAGLNASDEMETPTKESGKAAAKEIEQALWDDEEY